MSTLTNDKMYLRQNVQVEPLVERWYAWSHLISPATAAMNVVDRHLSIMESYVKNPSVHANAVKNPAMLGGPFIDYDGGRVDELKALIEQTRKEQAPQIAMSAAIKELDQILRNEAKGFSLEPLYAKVPEVLRGYVELVYDLNNQPSFRLIEPLLYQSRFYDPSRQSLMLSLITSDDRPFILSTPRLESPGDVHIQTPFANPAIDDLFRMKTQPGSVAAIAQALGVKPEAEADFAKFFTAESPRRYEAYRGSSLRWRYFGHACILVETADTSILLDPVLSYTYDHQVSRFTYEDLPDTIDYVLITHNHQDHILFETMLQLRHKVKNIVVPRNGNGALQDPSLKMMFERVGFKNIMSIEEFEEIPISTGKVTGVPFFGEHSDLAIRTKSAYLVETGPHRLLFAADSCNVEPKLYEHVEKLLGQIDVLFLGMECDGAPLSWLYGPLLTKPLDRKMDHSRRLAGSNYERGIDIVNRFKCKEAYVYAMGQEPWLNYVMSIKYTAESNPIKASNQLVAECKGRGIQAERLFGEKEILVGETGEKPDTPEAENAAVAMAK
jgi:L-ascorbate metabolism protein UlaG (beta-lactamase superfamily)